MNLQLAARKRAKIKMALQGTSGSGKTYSALLMAQGLASSWSKVAVIDTENHSAELYAHLGPYYVLHMEAPFTPEKYSEAIQLCEQSGMEVMIIDSLSHEWEHLLDYHANLPGNSFTSWGKVTPRHQRFMQSILQSPAHVICTIRTKSDYILTEKNGKQVPEKVGLKGIQRDGLEYDFTLVLDLDIKNNAVASKDRTGLFFGKPEFKINPSTGQEIANWCQQEQSLSATEVYELILESQSLNDLYSLYKQSPDFQQALKPDFEQRKRELIVSQEVKDQNPAFMKNANSNEAA